MFEVKQVIEGKIFIHHRRDEMLTVFHRHEVPAQYFEYFINAQNFTGHFVEYMLNQQIKFGWFILKRIAPIKLLLCLIRANTCCIFIL